MGRPSLLTPTLLNEIVQILQGGSTINDTCAYVGISEAVYHQWQARGRDEHERIAQGRKPRANEAMYVEFLERTQKARTVGRISAVATIRRAIGDYDKNPELATRNAQWLLERSAPSEWGKRYQQVEHTGNVSVSWDDMVKRINDAVDNADPDDIDPLG